LNCNKNLTKHQNYLLLSNIKMKQNQEHTNIFIHRSLGLGIQTNYTYDNTSQMYDYVFAFFYGLVRNDNYVYNAKLLKATCILPTASYTYNSHRQHSAQAFGDMDYEYDYI